MAVLSLPAVRALFHRGNFSSDDATILGVVLVVYAASIIGSGIQRGMLAPFFAKLDTKIPLRNTLYGVIANLALVPICMLPFGTARPRRGHRRGRRLLHRAIRERGAHLVPPAARPGHPVDGDGGARPAARRGGGGVGRRSCCSAIGCSTWADRTLGGSCCCSPARSAWSGSRSSRRSGRRCGCRISVGSVRRPTTLSPARSPGSGIGAATAMSRSSPARGRCGASSSAIRRRGGASPGPS